MTRTAPPADRPTPVFRECDGAPWPTDDELDLDAEWAAFREQGDADWWPDAEPPSHERVHCSEAEENEATCASDPLPAPASDGITAAAGDIDARLGRLEGVAADRHRATAEEYRLILAILDDAAFDPTPWVGPDPTADHTWHDARRRTIRAVQRDRIDLAERAAVAEIAVRLRLSEHTVRVRAAHARTLMTDCPTIWAAFGEGRLSERHAVEAARLAATLPAGDLDALTRFDEEACSRALTLTPAKFAVAARAIRERVHAESIETRHRRAVQDRGVWMTAELDGMASVHALLPADRARAVMSRLDRAARHLAVVADEERTLAQLRADALCDLVTTAQHASIDAAATAPTATRSVESTMSTRRSDTPNAPRTFRGAPPATVVVTVPALTLLGHDDEPATLEGYGPIDLDTARRLAGGASAWIRVLTHPVTGAPLVLDRTTYRVPAALRRWLGVTSPTCIFPGCARPARECDIDHRTAWADGGTTDDDNLDPECRHHHRVRHGTRWAPFRDPADGRRRWTSPSGAVFDTDPPPF
ncbi:HNH endonuclease signature motif containing protein [uncultured Microbacterium sp.]|uniref:HNH endonuclease signature motif containing protein n=1 Tax=uncultured Microbacterium sp. TaxID=191216 RepID=UPI0025FDC0C2|nr:HNH endonuclease signature motif containing protein [uncultured Microbacterium sp.]